MSIKRAVHSKKKNPCAIKSNLLLQRKGAVKQIDRLQDNVRILDHLIQSL